MRYDGRVAYGQGGAAGHTAHSGQLRIAIVHSASNVRHVLMPTDGMLQAKHADAFVPPLESML